MDWLLDFEWTRVRAMQFTRAAWSAAGPLTAEQVAPICHVPIWIFHGAKDGTVPVEGSVDAYEKLTEAGAA